MFDRPGIKYTVEDAKGNRAVTYRDLQEMGIAMKEPTAEQLRDPEWWDREAPEWAEGIGRLGVIGDIAWFNRSLCQSFTKRFEPEPLARKDSAIAVIGYRPAKPVASEWDGEGFPHAGVECEYLPDPLRKGEWERCIFLAHTGGEFFVLRDDGQVDRMSDRMSANDRFRPLKPPEQRERDSFARAILDDLDAIDISISGNTATAMAISLMNQGYRKLAKPGPEQQEEVLAIVHRAWIEAGTGDEAADITNALLAKFDLLRKEE